MQIIMGNTVHVGIIGCGSVAFGKHMPALSKVDTAKILGFYSRDKSKAEKACTEFGAEGAKVYENLEDMLQDPNIHAVHICTPNNAHAGIAVKALEAGKHVMCEKPMTLSSQDAQRMVDAAERAGKILTVGMQNRFRKDIMTLKEKCSHGDLGDIYYARAQFLRRRGVPGWGVMTQKAGSGGGSLVDVGVHCLDLAMYLMGNFDVDYVSGHVYQKLGKKPNEPNAFGPWDPEKFDVEDSGMAMIHMKNGAMILLETSWAINISAMPEGRLPEREETITLCGSEAGAEISHDGFSVNGVRDGELFIDQYELDHVVYNGAELEAKQWIESILNGTQPLVKAREALSVVRTLEAIYQSSETGKAVYL